jgi:NAD(P)-dependent dehydrogenase (short-subunit alcohol dehydrogenase family)
VSLQSGHAITSFFEELIVALITGGMGFIGLHTARKFLDAGENIVITRFRTWREPSFLKDEYGERVIVDYSPITAHASHWTTIPPAN